MNKQTILLFLLVILVFRNLIAQQPTYDFGKYSTKSNPQRCFTAVDSQSNFYVASNFSGTVNIDPSNNTYNYSSNGAQDIYVVKYNSSGAIEWVTKYGDVSTENINEMELDSQGNIFITGFFNSNSFNTGSGGILTTSLNGTNTFLIKISATNGNVLWAKAFQGTSSTPNIAFGYGLDIDNNDNIIISGHFKGTVDFDPSSGVSNKTSAGEEDIFIAKFGPAGGLLWVNVYGGASFENGFKVHCDFENNIIFTGTFLSNLLDFDPNSSAGIINHNTTNPLSNDSYLVKLNTNGVFVWGFQFSESNFRKITTDTQGNIYCVGDFFANTDFDPFIGVVSLTASSPNDAFTIKLTSSGGLSWVKQIGNTSYNSGISVALDIFGNIYTVGGFSGTNVDFDAGAGISTLSSMGGVDYYIQKLDNNGNFVWAVGSGSANLSIADFARDISIDGNGKCYVVGTMQGNGDIDPTSGTDNRIGSGIFFIRLSTFTNTSPITNNAVVVSSTLTDNGNNIPVTFQNQTGIISSVTPSGSNPVIGQLTAKIWVNTSGFGSYLNKNYEITPQINANTATGKVTIYFAQADFDSYNSTSTTNLPANPTDAIGIANLKIDKYSGTSSDNTGSPNSYGTTPTIIDPEDSDIVWNPTLNRWEVSFNVVGFSGFFIKGFINPCPTALVLSSTNIPPDDISSGIMIKEADATTGIITATNKVTGTANVIYRAGKSIILNAGFKAENGTVFKTEFGGCN